MTHLEHNTNEQTDSSGINYEAVGKQRASIGKQIHHLVDGTGKFIDQTAEIGATGIGHVGSMMGHFAGGMKNLFVKGWRSYRSHDLDPPNKTAA